MCARSAPDPKRSDPKERSARRIASFCVRACAQTLISMCPRGQRPTPPPPMDIHGQWPNPPLPSKVSTWNIDAPLLTQRIVIYRGGITAMFRSFFYSYKSFFMQGNFRNYSHLY